MRKIISKIAGTLLGLSLALGVGVLASKTKNIESVSAADDLYYTLEPETGTNSGYAGNCDIAISPSGSDISTTAITWNLTGNSTMIPWRIGGKNLSSTARDLYSKTAMPSAISKVEMTIGAASSVTINSASFVVASDSSFNTVIDTVSLSSIVNKTTTITPTSGDTWATGSYYKFTFSVTIGGNNKFIEFTRAKFYTPADDSLQSVSVSGTMTNTSYTTADDAFDLSGLTVTGNYGGTPKTITAGITWSLFDVSNNPVSRPYDLGEGTGLTLKVVATVSTISSEKYVASSSLTITYKAFTNSAELDPGKYVISYDGHYFNGTISSGKGNSTTTQPTTDAAKFTFALIGNDIWTIRNDEDDYLSIGTGSTTLGLTSELTELTVEKGDSSDTYKIRAIGGRYMAYYSSNSDFRTYNAEQSGAYYDFTLTDAEQSVVTYTITYNSNGGEGTMTPTSGANPEVAACSFTRDGYEFARWNTQADGEGDNYTVGTSISEDLTLYAIWQEYVAPIEGNVSMEGVTSASAVTVNGHSALKCGAGSTAGAMKLVLNNAGISKIKVYVAGWKGDTSKTINIETTGCSISEESISVTEDSAITGSGSAFTLNGAETTYRFIFEISNATAGAEITLTAAQASKNRFVAWGATDLFAESFANEFNSNLTCDVTGEDGPSFTSGHDWTTMHSFYNGLDAEEQGRLHDATFTVTGTGSSTVVTATGDTVQSVAEAVARYDYIVAKYGTDSYTNFINRSITPIASAPGVIPTINVGNSSTIVIVVVALTSITSIGVLLVIKRKRSLVK